MSEDKPKAYNRHRKYTYAMMNGTSKNTGKPKFTYDHGYKCADCTKPAIVIQTKVYLCAGCYLKRNK